MKKIENILRFRNPIILKYTSSLLIFWYKVQWLGFFIVQISVCSCMWFLTGLPKDFSKIKTIFSHDPEIIWVNWERFRNDRSHSCCAHLVFRASSQVSCWPEYRNTTECSAWSCQAPASNGHEQPEIYLSEML